MHTGRIISGRSQDGYSVIFTCHQELWHYQLREMMLKLQGGYEQPQKTNATTRFPSAFVVQRFGTG